MAVGQRSADMAPGQTSFLTIGPHQVTSPPGTYNLVFHRLPELVAAAYRLPCFSASCVGLYGQQNRGIRRRQRTSGPVQRRRL